LQRGRRLAAGSRYRKRVFTLAGAALAVAGPLCGQLALGAEASAKATPAPAANGSAGQAAPPQWSLLEKRCEKCHNSEDWAGGVAFDTMSPTDIASDAETWEKAVSKLRGRMMPPPGQAQPDQQTIDSFVAWMEQQLDRAAASRPAPGYVGIHRLNRTEYAREIKAMLGLDVDVSSLLPKDVSSDGFDNIAAVLRISPAFLDQYITAARNISRQAIGRVSAKPSSREYRVPPDEDQSEHIDGLPLGTRGGTVIKHYFPADGEYRFSIRQFFFGGAGYVTKIDTPQHVILTVDDKRVFEGVFGGPQDLKAVDQHQATAADEMQSRFNDIRVKVKAGEHRVGVTFIQRSFAESDSPLQPIAELPEMERVPNIPGVDISGPFNVTGLSETVSRKRVFICHPASAAEETPCARRILANLAEQAFRRPVTDEDLHAPMQFYQAGRQSGDFDAGIESGLTAILSSTKFLFRSDPIPTQAAPGSIVPVAGLALASRLSFLLWSQGPDQQLIDLATAGKLNDPAVLDAQVHRMLADPRSESLVTNFAFQWLNVSKMDTTEPTPVLYPEFDRNLREGYREEIRLFLDSILRAKRSVVDLLSSDQTFVNERVARAYRIPNIRGDQFRPVRLTDPNRWGLLGKGAILMGTAYGNRTSPVLRGSWILENIIGAPPGSPLPGVVTTLNDAEPGQKVETVRERMEKHRENPSCNACHGVMDPLGFALENFDVVGVWRDRDLDADAPIDSSGRLSSGVLVKGPSDLRAALLARPDQFVQTVTEKVMTFALGRGLRYTDMPMVRAIVRKAASEGNTFESILKGVVESDNFRMRQLPGGPAGNTKQAALTDSPTSLTEPEDCATAVPAGASPPARCLADNRR
jgi:mono/diheme cytochrome c family protein